MSPRTKISSVGYAMQALETDPTWSGNADATGSVGRMGRVGIGINTPEFDLHVVGAPSTHNYGVITVEGIKESNYSGAEFCARVNGIFGASFGSDSNEDYIHGWRNDKPLKIYTNQTERMRITPEGNIGIGTDNPEGRLHVKGTAGNEFNYGIITVQGQRGSGYTGAEIATKVNSDFGITIGSDINEDYIYGFRNDKPLKIYTSQTERMRITAGGLIGIGTPDPTEHLDLNGAIRLRAHLFDYNNTSGTTGQVLTRGSSGVVWGAPVGDNWGSQTVVSAATLSGNGTSGSALGIAQQSAATGQVLKWNGSAWAPGNDNLGGLTLPYTGTFNLQSYSSVFKIVLAHGMYSTAISGISEDPLSYGISGANTSVVGSGIGIYGSSYSPSGSALSAWYINSEGTGSAVSGSCMSPNGYSGYFVGGKFLIAGDTELQGKLGIGIANPTYRLGIYANTNASTGIASFHSLNGTQMVQIRQSTSATGGLAYGAIHVNEYSGTPSIMIQGNGISYFNGGYVGIGTSSPGYKLTVNGTAWCSAGAWTGSDIRWKKDITPMNQVLPRVIDLKAVNYFLRTEEFPEMGFSTDPQIGLIAQEVEKIFPQLVSTDPNGFKSIAYDKLSVLLLEAVKELKAENDELRQKDQQLKAENDQMNARLERLERALESLSER
jgi:hypothetical protein